MSAKQDRLARSVDRYEKSLEASGRMSAISKNANKLAEFAEKEYSSDLLIKEAKVDDKAVKADQIRRRTEMRKLQNELDGMVIDQIRANMTKYVEMGAENLVKGELK